MDSYQPPSKSETPEPLPRGPLWWLLVLPPLLVLVINLIIGLIGSKKDYGLGFLVALPVGLFILIACQAPFANLLRRRYRGSSLVLVSFGYFIGELVICLAVWFGSCLIFMN